MRHRKNPSSGADIAVDTAPREKASASDAIPRVEVIIEIPRGSFLKRGSTGKLDFLSPLPCPFNYGSVPQYIGGEGDLLDAVVLGPRLPYGSRISVNAYGAVGLSERFMYDDKLICQQQPLTEGQRRFVLVFFQVYARCKGVLNLLRGQRGRSRCEGWGDARAAIERASPVQEGWAGPDIKF
jgi:inorganic pyrophosphatase